MTAGCVQKVGACGQGPSDRKAWRSENGLSVNQTTRKPDKPREACRRRYGGFRASRMLDQVRAKRRRGAGSHHGPGWGGLGRDARRRRRSDGRRRRSDGPDGRRRPERRHGSGRHNGRRRGAPTGDGGGCNAPAGDASWRVPQQCTAVPDSGSLSITAAYASRIGQNLRLEVHGAGFGSAPSALPAVGEFPQFGITDTTQGGWWAGRSNYGSVQLQYTSWSDTAIVVDGFGPQYGSQYKVTTGDTVSIFVQNAQGPEFTVWTGTLQPSAPPPPDPGGPTPRVASVTFGQVGQKMHIEVDGAGFGPAPSTLPAVGEFPKFGITDATQGGWWAGRSN
jgi:hypothetical protein